MASPILGSAGATISYRFLKTPQAVVTLDDSVSGTSQKRRDCMSHVSGLWRVLGERIIVAFGASKTRAMVCNRAPEISRFPDAQLRIGGGGLEPVTGPRLPRTRWDHPGMTKLA